MVMLELIAVAVCVAHGATEAQQLPPTPPDYPTEGRADSFAYEPFPADFETRRRAYLEFCAANPGNGPYSEAARMTLGRLPDEARMQPSLDTMDARRDCADFRLNGILRLLYHFGDSPLLSDAFRARARDSILKFKYWPDEPGIDSMCYWSENHFILFAAGAYLAGQLYPDDAFTNDGRTGRDKMARFRPRILKWLDLRFKTGFNEWLSNVYYVEDLAPLLNLVDFCDDAEIARRAAMVTDLLLLDIALNSFHGVFGSTHGRTYENEKKWPIKEHTRSTCKLLFGMSAFSQGNMAATCLALSPKYRMPQVIYDIATDLERAEMVNRQRAGIRVEEAGRWGLDCGRLEDGTTLLALGAYAHPRTINLMWRMLDEYNWWENDFFEPFKKRRAFIEVLRKLYLSPVFVWVMQHDVQRNYRGEVNIYTYRTPDYMLSSAPDYRPGFGGDQHHVWQATLGPDTVCFTTHPARREGPSPNYWTGSGDLPRVAQINNVAIILYRISTMPGLYVTHELIFTHAWLPKDRFDEVVERDGWVFARKGDGYLALWSQHPYHWQTEEGEDKDREMIAPGKHCVWICELGRRAVDGEFTAFIDRILEAELRCDGLDVEYDSPSQGRLGFGWRKELTQDGQAVVQSHFPRYDNAYVQAGFPGGDIRVRHNDHWLHLDWEKAAREASALVDGKP